jgi:aspartate/methionine/tyrosine aminotransferase
LQPFSYSSPLPLTDWPPQLLLINSPANPTGAVYERELMQEMVTFAKKNNLLVLSDEIYGDVNLGPRGVAGMSPSPPACR